MKTKKSLLRRIKISGGGKIFHASNFHRHLNRTKSRSQLRRLKKPKKFAPGFEIKVRQRMGIA